MRVGAAASRRAAVRGRGTRVLPRPDRALQDPALRGDRGRISGDGDRQDPEVPHPPGDDAAAISQGTTARLMCLFALAVQREAVYPDWNHVHRSGFHLGDIDRLLAGDTEVQIGGEKTWNLDASIDRPLLIEDRDDALAEDRDVQFVVRAELHAVWA